MKTRDRAKSSRRNDGAGIRLLSEDEGRDRVRDLIASGDWWVFPVLSETALRLCAQVERRHYAGGANADFVVMFGPRLMSVAFARKRRMSAVQLARVIEMPIEEALVAQDILVATDSPDDLITPYRAEAFLEWVMGDDGWSAKGADAA